MQGVEVGHCNAAISAALTANSTIQDSTVREMLQGVDTYGKKDTLSLDARPEIDITNIMGNHDENSIVITEEVGSKKRIHLTHDLDPKAVRTFYISDPTDRSAFLQRFLEQVPNKDIKVKNLIRNESAIGDWEHMSGKPASITGAFCALSCVRHSVPIFSVLVNYITQELFVSCSAGNYMLPIEEGKHIDLEYVKVHGTKIFFPAVSCPYNDDARRYVTFVGKVGYKENLVDSELMSESELEKLRHYEEPGGPSRILYLSSLQPRESPIGLILANGEKIIEWVHWLPWIRFAQREDDQGELALNLFEIYRKDRIRIKDGVLMSTPPFYSIFKKPESQTDRMIIDIARFSDFDNPSKIRASLIVCPPSNTWVTGLVQQRGYRRINF